jgi:hypothetical protein
MYVSAQCVLKQVLISDFDSIFELTTPKMTFRDCEIDVRALLMQSRMILMH